MAMPARELRRVMPERHPPKAGFRPSVPWEQWEVSALHESAHAAMGHQLGRTPSAMHVFFEDRGDMWHSGGRVDGPVVTVEVNEDGSEECGPQEAFAQAMICLAGKAVETLVGHDHADGYYDCETVPDPYGEGEVDTDYAAARKWLERTRCLSDAEITRIMGSIEGSMPTIVNRMLPQIFALASVVVQRMSSHGAWPPKPVTIDGPELVAILDGAAQ